MHRRAGLLAEPTMRFVVLRMTLALAGGCGAAATAELSASTTPSDTKRSSSDNAPASVATESVQTCAVGSVYFGVDSALVDEASRMQLACIPRASARVSLVGMTDPRGTEEYNLALGDRRARSVAEHLQRLGYDAKRIDTRSLGEEVATGTSEPEWSHDRRVNFAAQ